MLLTFITPVTGGMAENTNGKGKRQVSLVNKLVIAGEEICSHPKAKATDNIIYPITSVSQTTEKVQTNMNILLQLQLYLSSNNITYRPKVWKPCLTLLKIQLQEITLKKQKQLAINN